MNDLPMLYVYTPDLTRNDGAPDEQPLVFATPRDDATPYVPAARLDAANLEIARLRGVLSAEPCRACHGTGRYDPYCWCCNESTHDHECPPSVACAHCRGTGQHFHAALTPKEPSDE